MHGWEREAHRAGARDWAAVPGDMVPSCLVAVLLVVSLRGFFPSWQQRGELKSGIIIPT